MANEKDMDGYVTRRELREELAIFKTEFKTELKVELVEMEHRLEDRIVSRLSAEFTRQVNAILEHARAEIGVLDDKYNALPGRVQQLEAKHETLSDRVQRLEDATPKPKRPRRAAR